MNHKTNNLYCLRLISFFLVIFFLQNTSHAFEYKKETIECLLCPELMDPDQYAKGSMKLMRQIAPGKNRWLFRSEVDFSHDFGLPAAVQPEFARLMSTFKEQGTQIVFVVQPTRGLMHHDKIYSDYAYGFDYMKARSNLRSFLDQLRAGGAAVPDMMRLVDNPPDQEYFYRRDHHWTPAGAKVTAKMVSEEIRHLPIYKTLSKRKYKTEPGPMAPRGGSINMALDYICGNAYGMQYVRGDQTVPADSDAAILFDDLPEPEVVLVGTSNSAARDELTKYLNFDGYLKEYLETDILNYALPGAGYDGAIIEYLHSPDYHAQTPPKIIIWEIPANYRLEDPLSYRQMIPAIKGGCIGSPLLKNTIKLPRLQVGQRIELLSNSGEKRLDLTNADGFLSMHISDRNVKHFYLIVYYDNGSRDKVQYRRGDIITGGQYYLELNRAPEFRNANILSVFLEPTKDSENSLSIEVTLCQ